MTTQQQHEIFAQALSAPIASMPSLTDMPVAEEDSQRSLTGLQQWICELLIKNQQLRMSLQSARALALEDAAPLSR
jgi:hypothetical protein